MRAATITDAHTLAWQEVPDPVPADDQVLVEVHAAGVNRADLMQRAGSYPPPPGWPAWPGLEIAGVVRALPPGAPADRFPQVGDEICALLGGGGYAELAAIPRELIMPIPAGLSMVEAAALPEALATGWLCLITEGNARPGETLLMLAGSSGLGSLVIPLAKSLGLHVITTVRSSRKAELVGSFGADAVIDTTADDLALALKAQAELGRRVDLAIDPLAGDLPATCLPLAAPGCRWVVISTLAGDVSPVPMRHLFAKGMRLIGSTLRSRSPQVKADVLAQLVQRIWPEIEAGRIRPTIHQTLPMERADEAMVILEDGGNTGKIILTVDR